MQISRLSGVVAFSCAVLAARPLPVVAADPLPGVGLQQLAAGAQMPLTMKLKDFNKDWQRFEASVNTNIQNQMISALGGGEDGGDGDIFFTQGQTVTLGNTVFLIVYRPKLKRLTLMDMMRGADGPRKPTDPLTPETTAGLALLNFQLIGTMTNIRPFDMAAEIGDWQKQTEALANLPGAVEARENAAASAVGGNLKQLGLGIQQYVQDFDEAMPPMKSIAEFKKALLPYVKSDAVFLSPVTKEAYVPNAFLNGRKMGNITLNPRGDTLATSELIMAYDATPDNDGARYVLYMDGHVQRLSAKDWTAAKTVSRIP